MSLVSDALRKAQREAAEREARAKGLAPPPAGGPPLQPFRRRQRGGALTPLRLAAFAAILVAMAGAAFYFLSPRASGDGAARSDESQRPNVALPVKGEIGSEAAGAARLEPSGPTDGEPPAASRDGATEDPQAAATEPIPPSLPASSDARTGAAPTREAATTPPPPPSLPAFAEEGAGATSPRQAPAPEATPRDRTASAGDRAGATPVRDAAAPAAPPRRWVREADLGGGAIVRLGGIAYSDAAPLAYLNGRLIGVGEGVEGWTVRAIRRAEVELERGDERAILSLR